MTTTSVPALSPPRTASPVVRHALLLVLAVGLVFGRITFNRFTYWDDTFTLHRNPHLNPVTPGSWLWCWTINPHDPNFMDIYMPVTRTLWTALALIARMPADREGITLNPAVFHAASVAVHALTAVLVYVLLRRLLVRSSGFSLPEHRVNTRWRDTTPPSFGPRAEDAQEKEVQTEPAPTEQSVAASGQAISNASGPKEETRASHHRVFTRCSDSLKTELQTDRAALLGALLFALHPVQTESLAWASGMKDLLAGLFMVAGLLCYERFATAPEKSPARQRWYLAVAAALLLGMLSKPSAMTLPVLALAVDRWLLGRPWRAVLRATIPLQLLAVPLMVVGKLCQPAPNQIPAALWMRPLLAGDTLAFYLYKLVWPLQLAVDYGRRPWWALQQGYLYWTWILPAALLGLAWRFRRGRPWLLAGAALFVVPLGPVLGLTTFDFQAFSTVADHYLYVALLGPALLLAVLLQRFPHRALSAAALLLMLALGTRSLLQGGVWADDLTLWRHSVAVSPHSYMSHANHGWALVRTDPRRAPDALAEYQKAVELHPESFLARDMLAKALWEAQRAPEAVPHVRASLAIRERLTMDTPRKLAEGYLQLATLQRSTGDLAGARAALQRAIELDPTFMAAREALLALPSERPAATR